MPDSQPASLRWRIIAGFAAIYLLWGASYLAIHFSLETLPPFLISGSRFTLAGIILFGLARRGGAALPTRTHWRASALLAFFMFFIANAILMQAQRLISSGLTATLNATVPFWFVLLGWLWQGNARPGLRVVFGLVLGFLGIVLLISPGNLAAGKPVDLFGALLALLSALSWSFGSLLSRRVKMPDSAMLGAGMNLIISGAMLLTVSLLTGEMFHLNLSAVSLRSVLAVAYLILGPSVTAFGSYMWLLTVVSPNRVATYAYVNPVIAVFLGWLLAGETLTPRTLIASAIIVLAVALITAQRTASPVRANAPPASHSVSARLRGLAFRHGR
jgi:drug/metabolite transporter (DMT)-like permease